MAEKGKRRIAILGGGPSGLFMYKTLITSGLKDIEIHIFERKQQLGAGMPYSVEGAGNEHITNVSDNEIPLLVSSIQDWVQTADPKLLATFEIDPAHFNEYKVLPRLFFGQYLSAQSELLKAMAHDAGIVTEVHLGSFVSDIIDQADLQQVWVEVNAELKKFDSVVVCTGHNWPKEKEGVVPGYYDSPYPPTKLVMKVNHAIAIKGSSLTAIDAIRTLARKNGTFETGKDGMLVYNLAAGSEDFKMIMHSRNGMLPAVRFHLEDSHLQSGSLLSPEEIAKHRAANNGFISLDFIFEQNFKAQFKEKDPDFFEQIKELDLETFVEMMMELRERLPPFQLLRAEYIEAEKSIKRHQSVYWKEMLAVLSFAMNYPAKYLAAEDMQRLQKVLMPLISIVIAFVPQSSCKELLALHDAGVLDLLSVGNDNRVEPKPEGGIVYHYIDENGVEKAVPYQTFVDCVGQPHLSFAQFPFKSLVKNHTVSEAMLKFASDETGEQAIAEGNKAVIKNKIGYYLKVPGIAINDQFMVVDDYGAYNDRIYMMAVPYIGGFNPDYSGLDFCEEASGKIIEGLGRWGVEMLGS